MKKKTIISITIFITILLIISGYFSYTYFILNPKLLKIELNGEKNITLEYGEEFTDEKAKAYFKDKDISSKIKTTNNLDLTKLGNYTYTYEIKYKNAKKQVTRKVNIVDTTSPIITLNGNEEIKIYVNTEYIDEGAKAQDNYDGEITAKIEIDNKLDNKTKGEYLITYSVTDSSNNKTEATRKIIVVEKPKETDDLFTGLIGYTSKGYKIEKVNGITYINGILIANKTYKLPKSYNPGGLTRTFLDNFNAMKNDAALVGINLEIISGFRDYNLQYDLYYDYVASDGKANADTYSARPGHSEHQTGLAADINRVNNSFGITKEGKWLNDNCAKYGFIIRYVEGKSDITGYMYEPWHIRYVGTQLAQELYNNGDWITIEEYFGIDSVYK